MKAPVPAIFLLLCALPAVAGTSAAQTAPQQQNPPTPATQPQPGQNQPVPAAQPQPQQNPSAAATQPPVAQPAEGEVGDLFPALREEADQALAALEETDKANEAEIETLMRTKRCQINHIGGDLDRNIKALKEWETLELKYWEVWGDEEQKRVEKQQKSLASYEEEQGRVADMIEAEKKNRQQLERDELKLEQSKRTEEIKAQIDGLIKAISQSEDTLAHAQQEYDDVTAQVNNIKVTISARLVNIRQNKLKAQADAEDQNAYYEKQRAAANEICNTKQPDTRKAPPPKAGGK
jgi:hypothetical protein